MVRGCSWKHRDKEILKRPRVKRSSFVTLQIDAKPPELPLARIKKIMKLDEDVKVILVSDKFPLNA